MLTPEAYQHMQRPNGFESMENADFVGRVGSETQGPYFLVFLKLQGKHIARATYRTYSCPWAIASGSVLVRAIQGRTLEDALKLCEEEIEVGLGSVPRNKRHCPKMAIFALRLALQEYCRQANHEHKDFESYSQGSKDR